MKDTPILPAATVVCTRHNDKGNLEVLLVKRNQKLAFASGFWVFPGGRIEDSDLEEKQVDEQGARTAAIRETKEEAGIDISGRDLFHFMKWTTPSPSKRRYRTWFFACHLDEDIEVKIDDGEIVDFTWITPAEALNTIGSHDIKILPPTFLALVRMSKCASFEDIKTEFRRSELLDIQPRTGMIDGVFQAMYPGDAGYKSHDVLANGPRHRITGNLNNGKYGFEYHGCPEVFPVHGGYDW